MLYRQPGRYPQIYARGKERVPALAGLRYFESKKVMKDFFVFFIIIMAARWEARAECAPLRLVAFGWALRTQYLIPATNHHRLIILFSFIP